MEGSKIQKLFRDRKRKIETLQLYITYSNQSLNSYVSTGKGLKVKSASQRSFEN